MKRRKLVRLTKAKPLPPTRRNFLAGLGAVAGAGALGFPAILRGQNLNSKMNLACIGVGGRGRDDLQAVSSENIVALCDVNEKNLAAAGELHPDARSFTDFRKLYDDLKDTEFDGVVVAIPEHVHAFATLPALRRGKHVYSEKPLTRDVREARLVIEAAAANPKLVTQMGTQIHAGDNYRRVVELIQAGAIGPVSECHVWVGRAWGWQSEADAKQNHDIVWTVERPKEEVTPPPFLNWDLWVGPAPMRPYNPVYFPGPKWYRWWDFGNGTMSDLGSHWNDLPWWALKLDAPKAIEASGPPPHAEIAPATMSAIYEYGPRGDMPALKLTWHQGASKPPQWTDKLIPQWGSGVLFVGTNGRMLVSDYDKHALLPEADFKGFMPPPQTIPKSIGHHAEWVRACKTGEPTACPFSYSGPLTEANHLGNVAYRAGKRIEWDTKNLKIPNAPEAEKFLGRDYRKGWSLT